MTDSGKPSRIAQFSDLLHSSGVEADAELLADMLWLSQFQDRVAWVPPTKKSKKEEANEREREGNNPPTGRLPTPPPKQKRRDQEVALRTGDSSTVPDRGSGGASGGSPFQTPAAPALRKSLLLGRSLRPLMQKVPSQTEFVLDEDATANQIAERKLRVPVLRPSPERWLKAVLVVEQSESTAVWKETIHEFQRLLEHQGAFRDVRTWGLYVDKDGAVQLCSKPHISPDKQRQRTAKELLDPSGRTLLLIISDCTSKAWQQGTMYDLLKLWMQDNLVTLVQLLPERLWERSALGYGIPTPLMSLIRGAKNAQFETPGLRPSQLMGSQEFLRLPVVTLEPDALEQWARVIAGMSHCQTPGILLDRFFDDDEPVADAVSSDRPTLSAEALVKRFSNTASPLAKRLAGLLAAVPVTLPVISLVQETMPSVAESSQIHVAEIIMSGLLKPVKSGQAITRYKFVEGVRERLIAPPFVTISEIDAVLDAVSRYIAHKAGLSIKSFTSLLMLQPGEQGADNSEILDFAFIAKRVLRRLGPEYAELIDFLDASGVGTLDLRPYGLKEFDFEAAHVVVLPSEPTEIPIVVATISIDETENPEDESTLLPGIERVGVKPVEVVRFVVEEPEESSESLESIPIRIAKVVKSGAEWVVRYDDAVAQRYVELLPGDVPLEMMAIASGEFMMGSPLDEPERYNDESPQHQVTIKDGFFMGRYPITQAQWRAVVSLPEVNRKLNPEPSNFKGDDRPVEQVSWLDACEFCDRLNLYVNRGLSELRKDAYMLPTEAEWEYACRANTTTPFHFGETITPEMSNYDGSNSYVDGPEGEARQETTPVTQFNHANAFGLSDMHGNVLEWCLDHWHKNYEGAPTDGSAWLTDNAESERVVRGGS
ncbi:MAG: formylglycine-generating enzyme family protein, partial [Cyanobacteria bacterium P01_A01_bin.37]